MRAGCASRSNRSARKRQPNVQTWCVGVPIGKTSGYILASIKHFIIMAHRLYPLHRWTIKRNQTYIPDTSRPKHHDQATADAPGQVQRLSHWFAGSLSQASIRTLVKIASNRSENNLQKNVPHMWHGPYFWRAQRTWLLCKDSCRQGP